MRAWHYPAIIALHGIRAPSTVSTTIVLSPNAGVTTKVTADFYIIVWREQTKLVQWLTIVSLDVSICDTDVRVAGKAGV